jgi:hypothetical protein
MPRHLGDTYKEGNNTRGRRRHQSGRTSLSSVSPRLSHMPGIGAVPSMKLRTAVTTKPSRCNCKAAILRYTTWQRDAVLLPPPAGQGAATTNHHWQDRETTRDGRHLLRETSTRHEGPSSKGPDLAHGGPDWAHPSPPSSILAGPRDACPPCGDGWPLLARAPWSSLVAAALVSWTHAAASRDMPLHHLTQPHSAFPASPPPCAS